MQGPGATRDARERARENQVQHPLPGRPQLGGPESCAAPLPLRGTAWPARAPPAPTRSAGPPVALTALPPDTDRLGLPPW